MIEKARTRRDGCHCGFPGDSCEVVDAAESRGADENEPTELEEHERAEVVRARMEWIEDEL